MRRLIPLLLVVCLAGCRKEGNAIAGLPAAARDDSPATRSVAVMPASQSLSGSVTPEQNRAAADAFQTRMIIRTATLSMIVDDTSAAMERLTAAVESSGGYVSDSRVWREGEQLRGTVSLRVPATKLSATLAMIRRLAVRIQSESLGSQEVTREYVDLESQLRNLEAAETELRQLMTTIRQNSKRASEVLEMYQQLASIRGQIEQIKGRMRYLSDMTALATVNVELVPNALAKPVVEAGWQPLVIVKDASRALVGALQSVAGAAIWFLIYVLPMFALVAAGALIVWKILRRAVAPTTAAQEP